MEVGLFVLGILVGVGLCWYLQERIHLQETEAREANFQSRLTALQNELKESDAALAETRDRLIASQMEQKAAEAEQRRATVVAPIPEAEPSAAVSAPDDLTRIKGIGRVMERRLHELGITTFRQLAELSPGDVQRINKTLDFSGRVEREHWVEQARSLSEA